MARTIAVANQKGGVGKTTTCVNLASALADMNYRTLLIDLDPQGNASVGCGIDARALEISALDVLQAECDIPDAMVRIEKLSLDVLPSNSDLTAAEISLLQVDEREYRLKEAIEKIAHQYAWIIIDCPPSLNLLTLNALTAANSVLIPMQCEYFALEGLSALIETISRVAGSVNTGLHVEGLLRTMYDPRNSLTNDVSAQLQEHFGDRLYRTVIPRNVRLAEAPSFGVPAIQYDPKSRGAQAYLALAGEVIRRQSGSVPAVGEDAQIEPEHQ